MRDMVREHGKECCTAELNRHPSHTHTRARARHAYMSSFKTHTFCPSTLTRVHKPPVLACAQVTQALLGKPAAEAGADAYVLRRLKADLQMELTAFKNAAFTSGYNAGKGEVVAFATRQYA